MVLGWVGGVCCLAHIRTAIPRGQPCTGQGVLLALLTWGCWVSMDPSYPAQVGRVQPRRNVDLHQEENKKRTLSSAFSHSLGSEPQRLKVTRFRGLVWVSLSLF